MEDDKMYEEQVICTVKNGVLMITLTGDIDHHTAMFLREITDRHITETRPKRLYLNMSRVAFMDSAGLGFILGRYRTATRVGASFCVLNPTERVDRILKLAGTEKLIQIRYENEKKGEA